MPIVRTEARRLYQCDCCGKLEPWSDSWAWYGSYRQIDDEGNPGVAPVVTMCSADCRVQLVAQNKLPPEGLDDQGNVIDEVDVEPPRRKASRVPRHDRQRAE